MSAYTDYTYTVTLRVTHAVDGQNDIAEASLKAKAEEIMAVVLKEGETYARATVVETP